MRQIIRYLLLGSLLILVGCTNQEARVTHPTNPFSQIITDSPNNASDELLFEQGKVEEGSLEKVQKSFLMFYKMNESDDLSSAVVTIHEPFGIFNENDEKDNTIFPIYVGDRCEFVVGISKDAQGEWQTAISKKELPEYLNQRELEKGCYRFEIGEDSVAVTSTPFVVEKQYGNLNQTVYTFTTEELAK